MSAEPAAVEYPGLHRPGWPVIEVFGPVVQGEGPAAGRPCYFIRFGGCDYRCSWCDSMYAVDPAEVREHATRMTADELVAAVLALPAGPGIVVLSGGNPALHDLTKLVKAMRRRDLACHVETQGSVWRPWLADVRQLVISPKPPSSGMATPAHVKQTARFMETLYESHMPAGHVALKVVVFDEADYEWASGLHAAYPEIEFYLSAGTPQGEHFVYMTERLRERVGDNYRWLCERAAGDADMADVVLLPQLHVIAFGAARGV